MEWHSFKDTPSEPTPVLYYLDSLNIQLEEGRDEKFTLGYWDGNDWHWNNTGHLVFDDFDTPEEWRPTHWTYATPPKKG